MTSILKRLQVITLPCNNPTTPPKPSSSPNPNAGTPSICFYTIKSGDSLDAIASARQTTVEAITALNPGIVPTSLQIGQVCVADLWQPLLPLQCKWGSLYAHVSAIRSGGVC